MESQLLACLSGTLDPQLAVRTAAEQQLTIATSQQGFAPALVRLALMSDEVHEGLRQLSLVIAKKFVKEHWDSSSKHFQAPECSEADKTVIQQLLPRCLADPSSKVRTAAAMVISGVAKHGLWPGMLEWMLQTLWEQQNSNLVMGVLRCLSMLAEDIDEQQLPQLVPTLLPSLLRIMNNPAYGPAVHKNVLSIVHSVLMQLGVMQGVFQRQIRDLLTPLMEPWIPVLAAVLSTPLTKDSSCWGLKMECLQVMNGLVVYFAKGLGSHMPTLLAPCWHMFTTTGRAMYQELLVCGEGDEAVAGDGDEDGVGLEAMLAQMFDLLLSLVGNSRFSKLLKPAAAELALVTITYMQMTHEQAESWADNPNTYVADEEEAIYTARVSGELMLDSMCKAQGLPAIFTTLSAVERTLALAEHTRQGQPTPGTSGPQDVATQPKDWWKLREAAVLAAGCLSEALQEELEGGGGMMGGGGGAGGQAKRRAVGAQCKAKVQALLDSMLQQDLQGPHSNPFLAGRALWAAAKLSPFMTPSQVDQYLAAACAGIRSGLPAPVRVGACRALVQLLPLADRPPSRRHPAVPAPAARLAPALPSLYEGLVVLLGESCEETLHLVLETLAVVIKNDTSCVVQQYLAQVSGPVLRVWEGSVADPLIGEDATLVLAELAAHTQCLLPLVNQLVPALVRVISAPSQQRPMLVEASLQLLRKLIRRPAPPSPSTDTSRGSSQHAPALSDNPQQQQQPPAVGGEAAGAQHLAVVQQVYLAVIVPLLAIFDTSDDSSVQQEAQQLLCQMIRYGRAGLLSWGGADPSATVERLVTSVLRLLGPSVGEMESALAGHVAADMVSAFPSELMQPHMNKLLDAVCCRLVCVNISPLVTGLLTVLSVWAHSSCHALLDALTRFNVTLPSGQTMRALDAVLPIWIERSRDVHGRYHTALVTTALAALLESGNAHLQQVQVKGKRLDVAERVQTRSQLAAAGGERYNSVGAHLKLVAALAQVLADTQEAARDGPSGEGDWEEDEEDEGESDEEDEDEEEEEGEEGVGASGAAGLAVQGSAYTPAQEALLGTVTKTRSAGGFPGISGMAIGNELLSWGADDGGPLSPSSALHDDDTAPGADDAAPPGDPLATLDLGAWVSELFQRLALQDNGTALLQAASELAMTRKQTEAVQKLLQGSRLRAE